MRVTIPMQLTQRGHYYICMMYIMMCWCILGTETCGADHAHIPVWLFIMTNMMIFFWPTLDPSMVTVITSVLRKAVLEAKTYLVSMRWSHASGTKIFISLSNMEHSSGTPGACNSFAANWSVSRWFCKPPFLFPSCSSTSFQLLGYRPPRPFRLQSATRPVG